MFNFDFTLLLVFVAAIVITQLLKRKQASINKQRLNDADKDHAKLESSKKLRAVNDLGSLFGNSAQQKLSDQKIPDDQFKTTLGLPLPLSKPAYKTIMPDSLLPRNTSVAKVAKRVSPYASHYRQKKLIQLAIIDRVVLGPCRAEHPYDEYEKY